MPKKKLKEMSKKGKNNKKDSTPLRTCISCRQRCPKKDMIRLVLKEGKVPVIDCKGKVHGRGANVCAKLECFENAVKNGAFNRAWEKNVKKESLLDLKKVFVKILDQRKFRKGDSKVVYRVGSDTLKKKLEKELI